ncbi:MAG: sulfotransferase [Pseudomonadota bacterium]
MTAHDPYSEDIRAAKKLLREGDFKRARIAADGVLSAEPNHQEALYICAVAARYSGDFPQAMEFLDRLVALAPEYARAHQERGHCYKTTGATGLALQAYQYAAQLNPSLLASLKAIVLLSSPGSHEQTTAKAQVAKLESLPKALVSVINHLAEGRILQAEDVCRAFLKSEPTHTEGMRLLADIGVRLSVLDDAEFLLDTALKLAPDDPGIQLDYINVLRKRHKYAEAHEQAKLLSDREPENPVFLSHLAIESMHLGLYDDALQLFDKVLEKAPSDPATLTSKGHALKTAGRQNEAVACYADAIATNPSHADAFYALANLKTHRFSDAQIAEMERQHTRSGLPLGQKIQFHFALGKAYEDREKFEESFSHYRVGNDLKGHQTRYDSTQMLREFEAQIDFFTEDFFRTHCGPGCEAQDPIFIVGLPRSGSTLLEQILASHSQVDGTLELPNILSLAHRLRSNGPISQESAYPEVLGELDRDQLTEFGKTYLEETRIHRSGAPRLIDKMPNNFRHIGLIRLILPNARIIDARREPMACCFSGYKQLFAEGQEFTYALDDIGAYYQGYVRLMDHWDRVLPQHVLRVHYEDVVENLEHEVRRILEFCGLPFEHQCLEFHKTKRSVRTASSEQVRQPIYGSGVDQWRNYERFLAPLKEALGPALEGYRK